MAEYVARPDNPHAQKLELLDWRRLTPPEYDRNIFHVSLRVDGSPVAEYEAGDSLAVYPLNDLGQVRGFLAKLKLDPDELLELPDYFAGTRDGTSFRTLLCTFKDRTKRLHQTPTRRSHMPGHITKQQYTKSDLSLGQQLQEIRGTWLGQNARVLVRIRVAPRQAKMHHAKHEARQKSGNTSRLGNETLVAQNCGNPLTHWKLVPVIEKPENTLRRPQIANATIRTVVFPTVTAWDWTGCLRNQTKTRP